MVRPSKTFLYDLLESKLKNLSGEVGLDAASANFKNRRMFKTKAYYGLDRDLNAIQRGLAKFKDDSTFGILADLTKLDAIPSGSAEVVVSTNTLYQLAAPDRKLALEHLCRVTASKGHFLVEMSLDGEFDRLLATIKQEFSEVKIWYYQNFLSRFYERIFERNGYLGDHPIAGRLPFRLLAWVISRLEYLTRFFRLGNRHALIFCHQKNNPTPAQNFNLSFFPLLDKKIYKLS